MAELTKQDVRPYLDNYGNIVPNTVGDTPLHPDFTPNNLLFASSSTGIFTVYGSLYFDSGRRIRLCHKHKPKISARKNNMRRYCVKKSGRHYYKTNKDIVPDVEDDLKRMGALTPANAGVKGTLLEFWDGGRHLSRGRPIAVALTQRQLNFLCIAAVMQKNHLMKACWQAAGL